MIALNREVNDAKALTISPSSAQERESYGGKEELAPQWREPCPERDMHRLALAMERTRPVRSAAPRARLASSALARATPATGEFEGELSLSLPRSSMCWWLSGAVHTDSPSSFVRICHLE